MKIKKILVSILTIIVAAGIGLFVYLFLLHQLPKTEEMQKYYFERQSEFEKINNLILSKLKAAESIESKRNKALGYRYIETTSLPFPSVKYYTHFRGIGVASFGTGIAYLEKPPNKIYPSLEAMRRDADEIEGFLGYGHLSNHWYYFLWEAD